MPAKLTKRYVEALQPKHKPYDARDSEVTGFLVRVEKSGHKAFWLAYSFAGKRGNRYKLGEPPSVSVEGARALAKEAAYHVAKGIDPQARRKAERIQANQDQLATLGAFLDDRFEPWALTHMKSGKEQLTRIRSDFADQLDQRMDAINPFMIEGMRQKWKKAGMKPRSINRDIQRLQSVLSRAKEWGVLDRHPLNGVKPMKYDKTPRVRYLSDVEEAALRAALITREERMRAERIRMNTHLVERGKAPLPDRIGDHLDHLRPMVLLAMNCGMRRGELFSLRWDNVRLKDKWLKVIAATAKSGQSRDIPLNTEAVTVLTAWHKRQSDTTGLVFPSIDGARLNNINKSWAGVLKDAAATAPTIKGFHFHDLRHSFASKLVQSGVDLNLVRQLLGHKDFSTTLMYAHLDPKNLIAAVAKIAVAS
jgi:integrase